MHGSIYTKLKDPLPWNKILFLSKGQNIKYTCMYLSQVRQTGLHGLSWTNSIIYTKEKHATG